MTELRLDKVSKNYGPFQVLKDINLNIRSGELIVIIGPSGCGKSTLLRMIAGLENISSGDMYIDNVRVNDIPPVKRRVAMVFQSYALYPHMNVAKNMAFGLSIQGASKSFIEERVNEAAKILKLEDYLHRKPKELSGGQRQRVAIGRAIVREPSMFLFDEPLSNLDAGLRTETRVEIAELHKQFKAPMIYVTHDQLEAMTLADRIVVLNGGHIEQVGKPLDLYNNPVNKFVAGFIGSQKMNFLPGIIERIENDGISLKLEDNFAVKLPVAANAVTETGSPVTLGIRPEHLTVSNDGSGISTKVMFVEQLGDVSLLHLMTKDGQKLIARISGQTQLGSDDNIVISFDPSLAIVFDQNDLALQSVPEELIDQTEIRLVSQKRSSVLTEKI